MSIGFAFTAEISREKNIRQVLDELAEQDGYAVYHDKETSRVHFCRMGDLFLTFDTTKKGPLLHTKLSAECTTSLVGAGFHAAAIDFVDMLANKAGLKISMVDETNYYTHRNFEQMRTEHFYGWLQTLVSVCREQSEEYNCTDFCICWDLNQYTPRGIEGFVVTPFGRLNMKKLVERVQTEGMEPFASEFFLWNERERDARFYRNTALAILWEDCYFMPSSRSSEDERVNTAAIKLLEKAAEMDQGLPFPVQEYRQLCRLDGREPMNTNGFPVYQPDYPVGYRKEMVTEKLGCIRFSIPGSFLYEYDQEDGASDHVWYDGLEQGWHTVRITAFHRKEGNAEFSETLFQDMLEPPCEFHSGDGQCRAGYAGFVQEEGGGYYYQSIGEAICGQQVMLMTVSYRNPEDKAWAMELFQSVQAVAARTESN